MEKNTILTLRSAIAYTLLISQLLTSCVKPVIHPDPEPLVPITHHQEPQDNAQQAIIATRSHHTVVGKSDSGKVNHNLDHSTITHSAKRPRKAITITQPVGSKKVAQLNCLPSQKLFTEQVQQELHKSIELTLADPVWRKHLLEDKSRDRKASEVNTIPQNNDVNTKPYQPARIQTALQPLTPALTLPVKEGLTIRFIQDTNHWWGVVEETYPGFSRSTVLPVLYQQALQIPINNANHVPPTIEALSQLPLAVQQQLVHIFSSSKTLRDAFIYLGEQMGLNGGGFWSDFGKGLLSFGIVTAGLCMTMGSLGIGGVIVGSIWVACGMCIAGTIEGSIEEVVQKRLEQEQNTAKTTCENAVESAKNCVDKIKQDPTMYKDKSRMQDIFSQLNSARKTIDSTIKHLEQVKKNIEDKYTDSEVSGLESSISDRKGDRGKVDNHIQDAKNEFKRQAQEGLKEARKQSEEATHNAHVAMGKAMEWLPTNIGLGKAKSKLADMKSQVNVNIHQYESWKSMYENWQSEFSIDTSPEIKQIKEYLDKEKKRKKRLQRDQDLVDYMNQQGNMANIQQMNEGAKNLQDILGGAVEVGDTLLLYYAFSYNQKSPTTIVDDNGNTVLHLAIITNQVKVVELCLEYGANKLTKNREGKTPLDLAANKPEIRKLLEEKK